MSKKICQFCKEQEATKEVHFGDYCFDCWFWLKKLHLKPEDKIRQAIIGGNHWMIGYEGPSIFRGMGGRRYIILFNDGRLVETTNLWHQGLIPTEFRTLLLDNAVFVAMDKTSLTAVELQIDEIPF